MSVESIAKDTKDESFYECNICLETAQNAVVSMCGHLYCWPCLHQWLMTQPNRKLCPVCKSAVDRNKVIPLYGRNDTRREDPRDKTPPRPIPNRSEPVAEVGFGRGFRMSFDLNFPFGSLTSSLNLGEPRNAAPNRGTRVLPAEELLSKFFLYLAFILIAWLLFA
ncbi:E3 ubiquitin-protein ligase RNF185 [Drosophila yakuba]|uniref:RING-type E3 ubiquitin transferase n=1 Tax=Drosophila yakuba TaxID=7245 RepID=A0A0R1DXY3_DROYA|nr:E3 ubiquitin-protein ligase RNF185 [Drosophila yakuba]KRK01932.1 uncharacterized protein Dyak_GE29015 [Drosophila yakuba]